MRLSTKGRYAVMAMVDLASHGGEAPVALSEIAERQEISLSYLEQLFAMLRRSGLVRSVRGPGGGYLLAFDRSETRIADIILAVDEPIRATRCTPGAPVGCRGNKMRCLTHDLWEELGNQIHLYSEFGIARRCLRAPRARHQRAAARAVTVRRSRRRPLMRGRREAYLDWNATAPLRPTAAAAIGTALGCCGNPSSVHRRGRLAREAIESARAEIAALVAASPEDVVFVSGGTEANHLALRGCGRERVLVSAVEHDSVRRAVPAAEPVPVDRDGVVDLDALDGLLSADVRPALVSVMLANNETGVVQPVSAVAALARAHRALFHCDAVQAAGKMRLDLDGIDADLVTLSAHKLGGPPGVGALVARDTVDLLPMLRGGGQERGRRAGTENLPGIAGFGAAATAARTEIAVYDAVRRWRDMLEAEIAAAAPAAVVLGAAAPRLPNTSAIALPGIAAETQVIALDLDGVMVSAGAACSSGKVGPSHVLAAMAVPAELAAATIRVSLGWETSEADIERFLGSWLGLYRRRHPVLPRDRAA